MNVILGILHFQEEVLKGRERTYSMALVLPAYLRSKEQSSTGIWNLECARAKKCYNSICIQCIW